MATTADELREEVRRRYAAAARSATEGSCGCDCETEGCCSGEHLGAEASVATALSLGCGNPTAVAELKEGEVVLDLGSGGGLDVILSARRVGPTGVAYGLDMTDEMLARRAFGTRSS